MCKVKHGRCWSRVRDSEQRRILCDLLKLKKWYNLLCKCAAKEYLFSCSIPVVPAWLNLSFHRSPHLLPAIYVASLNSTVFYTNALTNSHIPAFSLPSLCLLCCNSVPLENQCIAQVAHKQPQLHDFQPKVQRPFGDHSTVSRRPVYNNITFSRTRDTLFCQFK